MKLLLTNLDGYNKLEDYLNRIVTTQEKLIFLADYGSNDYRLNFMFIHKFGMFEAFAIPTNLYIHEINIYI